MSRAQRERSDGRWREMTNVQRDEDLEAAQVAGNLRTSSISEEGFQRWYSRLAKTLDLNPDPDNPLHFYDYRAAFRAGAGPGLPDCGRGTRRD